MIPLRDANPTRRQPIVTIGIIVACFVAFGIELGIMTADGGDALDSFIARWGVVPAQLLAAWSAHPYLARKPPKAVPAGEFGEAFVSAAFDAARSAGGTLNDLLCTATHFVARCVGAGVRPGFKAWKRKVTGACNCEGWARP